MNKPATRPIPQDRAELVEYLTLAGVSLEVRDKRNGVQSTKGISAYREAAEALTADGERIAELEAEIIELRSERDALLQVPVNLAKMDSIDEDATDRMIAYYWHSQCQDARKALGTDNG